MHTAHMPCPPHCTALYSIITFTTWLRLLPVSALQSKFAERYSAHSYGSLVRRTLGKKLAALLATIMVV